MSDEESASNNSTLPSETPAKVWKYLDAWEENGWTLDKLEYAWLAEIAGRLEIQSVLEFGPGSSTWAFLEHDCSIWSLEHNPEWVGKTSETFKDFPTVQVIGYEIKPDLEIPELEGLQVDCAFVDGPNGSFFTYHSRLCSLDFARTRTDMIFFHDALRPKEQRSIEYMRDKGWRIAEVCPVSYRGFILMRRDPNWSPGPRAMNFPVLKTTLEVDKVA